MGMDGTTSKSHRRTETRMNALKAPFKFHIDVFPLRWYYLFAI